MISPKVQAFHHLTSLSSSSTFSLLHKVFKLFQEKLHLKIQLKLKTIDKHFPFKIAESSTFQ